MVFDERRNDLYARALKQYVNSESIVLDLGAGLGIHGFVAAKLGAKKVYLVDPSPVLEIAQNVAKHNGIADRVVCIKKPIEQVELPEKVDIITSVFTGNFLLTEDLLPLLFFARDRFLKPEGKLLPDRAQMEVAAVSLKDYYKKHITCWDSLPQNIDYGIVRDYAVNNLYYDSPQSYFPEMLSEPASITEFDFSIADEASCRSSAKVKIAADGICHGWLGWFKIRLGKNWLSTSPSAKQTHWTQVFMPLGTPLQVRKGESIHFQLHRPQSSVWTWKTDTKDEHLTNSTFLASPVHPHLLQKQTKDYRPTLSRMGAFVSDVLRQMDGSKRNKEIISGIKKQYQDLFKTDAEARKAIQKILEKYVL